MKKINETITFAIRSWQMLRIRIVYVLILCVLVLIGNAYFTADVYGNVIARALGGSRISEKVAIGYNDDGSKIYGYVVYGEGEKEQIQTATTATLTNTSKPDDVSSYTAVGYDVYRNVIARALGGSRISEKVAIGYNDDGSVMYGYIIFGEGEKGQIQTATAATLKNTSKPGDVNSYTAIGRKIK